MGAEVSWAATAFRVCAWRLCLVAVPVGGGGAWPGFEIDHSERSSCVAISRAGRRPQAQPAGSSGQASRCVEVWWRSCRAEARQAGVQRPEASKSKRAIEE